MDAPALVVSLPTSDLRAAYDFYREGLGLQLAVQAPEGELPEPVTFVIAPATHLMLVPADGFGWVIGDNQVAAPGASECVLGLSAANAAAVDETIERAAAAGAGVVTAPGPQPWGYSGAFSDLDRHVWLVTAADGAGADGTAG